MCLLMTIALIAHYVHLWSRVVWAKISMQDAHALCVNFELWGSCEIIGVPKYAS